jgi:hypothetical protein
MRYVVKSPSEPAELTRRRALSPALGGTYAALEKPPMIDALMRDQGYLCGFCMRRVELFERDARGNLRLDAHGNPQRRVTASNQPPWKIAHWEPQNPTSTSSDRSLDWTNMIGACRGGDDLKGGHGPPRTCDTLQGNRALRVNPYDRRTVAQVKGRSARPGASPKHGEVGIAGYELYSDDDVIDGDLRLRLGLNEGYLPDNRKGAIEAFRALLSTRCPAHATLPAAAKRAKVKALYDEWKWEDQAKTRLRPFCGAVEVLYGL